MRIAITGAAGQLGRALTRQLSGRHTVLPLTRENCEIEDPACRRSVVALNPDLVIHAAALTQVDRCALDPARARRVNAWGTRHVALACQMLDVPMVYISSNEVFDGRAAEPYRELDPLKPANPYGQSKAEGEEYVRLLLRRFYIVRVSWIFGPGGNNFVSKILAAGRSGGPLRVVTDEISSPTYAPDLAAAVASLIETEVFGIYHLTNEGICSRFEYAQAALAAAGLGEMSVEPIRLAEFSRPSTPPPYSPLANECAAGLGIRLRPWQEAAAEYVRGGWPELAG